MPVVQRRGHPVRSADPVIDFRELVKENTSPRYDERRVSGEPIIADPNETRNRERLGEIDQKILDRLEEEERLKKQRRKSVVSPRKCRPLSLRQFKVLRAIEWFIEENDGLAPVNREIGLMLGGLTANAAGAHVTALEKKGYLTREPRKARSIRILIPSSEVKLDAIPQDMSDPDPA